MKLKIQTVPTLEVHAPASYQDGDATYLPSSPVCVQEYKLVKDLDHEGAHPSVTLAVRTASFLAIREYDNHEFVVVVSDYIFLSSISRGILYFYDALAQAKLRRKENLSDVDWAIVSKKSLDLQDMAQVGTGDPAKIHQYLKDSCDRYIDSHCGAHLKRVK